MKKFIYLIIIFAFAVFTTPLFAQEDIDPLMPETTINSTKYFELSLVKSTQNPFTKSITYTLTIRPLLDSSKTEILWNYPSSLEVKPKHDRFISLKEGEIFTAKVTVKPKTSGTYNISASVIAWQYNTNYTNSASDSLTFGKGLVLQPVSSEYTTSVILMYVGIFLISGILIFIASKLIKKGSEKAKKWLTPPS